MFSIIRNKQGFTAIEALVGFVLFSSMMLLYVPALTQSIQTFNHVNTQTKQWQLFYDLYQLQPHEDAQMALIQNYNDSHEPQLIDYHLSDVYSDMSFSDYSQMTFSLIDIR